MLWNRITCHVYVPFAWALTFIDVQGGEMDPGLKRLMTLEETGKHSDIYSLYTITNTVYKSRKRIFNELGIVFAILFGMVKIV